MISLKEIRQQLTLKNALFPSQPDLNKTQQVRALFTLRSLQTAEW
jgi:hypothetical protein